MFVAAALLKDLLRSLPDCLLMCGHYAEWVQLAEAYADNKVVDPVKRCVSFARITAKEKHVKCWIGMAEFYSIFGAVGLEVSDVECGNFQDW